MRLKFMPLFVCLAPCVFTTRLLAQDFAPDGTLIALPWSGIAQSLNTQTGVLTSVPRGEAATLAKWSPNGRYLVFVSGRTDTSLRLFDTKTGTTRVLGANLTFPVAWREDSNRIAFFHVPLTGNSELIQYGVSEKGIALRTKIDGPPKPEAPMVWLPATDNVAFAATDGNVYSVEEGEIKKITTSSDVIGMELSGDRKSLVWARRGPNPKYILVTFYTYDLTSRSVKRLDFPGQIPGINPTPKLAPLAIERASLSPDGSRAALQMTMQQPGIKGAPPLRSTAVFVVRMDGTGARQVATGGAAASLFAFWAKDSKTLAVLRTGQPGNALLIADQDGNGSRALLGTLR